MKTINLKDTLNKFNSQEERIKHLHKLTLARLRVIAENPSEKFRSSDNGQRL